MREIINFTLRKTEEEGRRVQNVVMKKKVMRIVDLVIYKIVKRFRLRKSVYKRSDINA